MSISRREFIGRGLGAALGIASTGVLGADDTGKLPIVDTHQHLWDLSKFRLPWVAPGSLLDHNFLTPEYRKASEGLNVVKAVYMEVAVAEDQKLAEAEYIVEVCRRTDNLTVAAVIGGNPGSDDFRQYITRFKDSPYVKGLRRALRSSRPGEPFLLQDKFVQGVQLLGEMGMSFDLSTSAPMLAEGATLVDRCAGTRFVLNHCGNADPKWTRAADGRRPFSQWQQGIGALAKRKNVICKISGIIARAPEDWTPNDLAPIVNHCIDSFGPDRVVFAGDWPVCTKGAPLRQWVNALKQITNHRGLSFQRKLFHDNAVQFYGLNTLSSSSLIGL